MTAMERGTKRLIVHAWPVENAVASVRPRMGACRYAALAIATLPATSAVWFRLSTR